ncbi:MAG: hypothetical protein GY749_44015, partial [Desulfobacteraceae bacterium]|nr:hypothetical protein [Desulfobacteraceae bacterium]
FREGKNTDIENPPEILETEEMRQVMKVLDRFSENERDYFLYQSRLEAILKENTYLSDIEEALRGKEQAQKEKEQAVKQARKKAEAEREKALKMAEKLRALGIDPDKAL